MWLMLQQADAEDYVIATGKLHSVREFVQLAFGCVGLNWEQYVVVDPDFYRPSEKTPLVGSPEKARKNLGWVPSASFEEIVKEMVHADCERIGVEVPAAD